MERGATGQPWSSRGELKAAKLERGSYACCANAFDGPGYCGNAGVIGDSPIRQYGFDGSSGVERPAEVGGPWS